MLYGVKSVEIVDNVDPYAVEQDGAKLWSRLESGLPGLHCRVVALFDVKMTQPTVRTDRFGLKSDNPVTVGDFSLSLSEPSIPPTTHTQFAGSAITTLQHSKWPVVPRDVTATARTRCVSISQVREDLCALLGCGGES